MQNEYECTNNFLTHLIKCETNWEGLSLINIIPIFPCQIPCIQQKFNLGSKLKTVPDLLLLSYLVNIYSEILLACCKLKNSIPADLTSEYSGSIPRNIFCISFRLSTKCMC